MSFICPYCFESINRIDDVHYVCTDVGHSKKAILEEDLEYARYHGLETYTRTSHVVRSYDKRSPKCDVCGAPLTTGRM